MVMMYGMGGMGMTTMAPNALLMKAKLGRNLLYLGLIYFRGILFIVILQLY
jgi:nitrogenase subunit NifH